MCFSLDFHKMKKIEHEKQNEKKTRFPNCTDTSLFPQPDTFFISLIVFIHHQSIIEWRNYFSVHCSWTEEKTQIVWRKMMWNFTDWENIQTRAMAKWKMFSLHPYTRAQTKETKLMRKNTRFSPLFRSFFQFACFSSCSLHNVQFSSDRSFCWHFGCAVWFSFHVFHTLFVAHAYHRASTNRVCARQTAGVAIGLFAAGARQMPAFLFSFHRPWRIQSNANETVAEIHAEMCVEIQRARQIWGTVHACCLLFTMGYFAIVSFSVRVVGHIFSTIFNGTFSVSCFLFMGYLSLLLSVFVCGFFSFVFFRRIGTVHHCNHMRVRHLEVK